ncbi:FAD-dependent oxidoreductase [Pseudomonas sp. GD03721]|nr:MULTISPECIES: FAD-dependent oxidoreductase [unclassified Pseudomonas]MDH1440424.1 FAD-dependent oxidoreductase [Pseudomonas sp. GD03722]WGG03488.1 FAD-dependent oxidoreductase [Pseudomonas sp. GD03721]WGG07656.1 FAD-dependent oxidoreductase [Pseudomonas sp. GD03919]
MHQTCIIIGASHAAAQLAPSLRQEGWEGDIIVIGDEQTVPYHRPPLSKTYLLAEKSVDDLLIRPAAIYTKNAISFRLGQRVSSIDPAGQTVTLDGGETLSYDKLALCTGARVRQVNLPGSDLAGVHYLRTLKDVDGIREHTGTDKHAVIVGGGYIGLETAAALRKIGMQVTVLEMAPRVLARVTATQVSAFFQRIHAEEGVTIRTDTQVSGFEGSGQVSAVLCSDGSRLPADLVIVGIGVIPNTELAASAGLDVDNGILVDELARTSDPHIVAAGDCTNHPSERYGRLRLESVPNASEQAKTAAATICGKCKPHQSLPWFWSDQYDLKLQIAGLNQGYDQVVIRGDLEHSRSFAAFYLQAGKLIAADCVNRPQEFMLSKRLIASGTIVNTEQLADDSIEVKALMPA